MKSYGLESISKIDMPFLLSCGDKDVVVNTPNLMKVTTEAPAEKKEMKLYPGVDHYVLNSGIWLERIIADQIAFLDSVF